MHFQKTFSEITEPQKIIFRKNERKVKSKILLQTLIILLIGCSEKQLITNENLESNIWFDKFGNEYKFENSKLETKPYLGQIWWKSGDYKLQNNSFFLVCEQDSTEEFRSELIAVKEDKITFEKPIEICLSLTSENEQRKKFELWKELEQIRDKEEKLASITFKTQPMFLYRGIRNFKLTRDKKVEIGFNNKVSIDTTYFLNDTTFHQIENLIQILPIEEYDDKYEFAIIDGVDFEVELITNKASKKVNGRGSLPKGLNNLFQYINHELK